MKNSLQLLPILLLSTVCTLARAQAAPKSKSMAHA